MPLIDGFGWITWNVRMGRHHPNHLKTSQSPCASYPAKSSWTTVGRQLFRYQINVVASLTTLSFSCSSDSVSLLTPRLLSLPIDSYLSFRSIGPQTLAEPLEPSLRKPWHEQVGAILNLAQSSSPKSATSGKSVPRRPIPTVCQ